jgi:hypothetical protein
MISSRFHYTEQSQENLSSQGSESAIFTRFSLRESRTQSSFAAFKRTTVVSQSVDVPEPSTFAILAIGTRVLASRRLKK